MNPNLFALRAFVAVASALNFNRAAAELHISPSRLTRTIQSLEAELGTQLFARGTHSTALTTDGAEFLPSARRILAEADWAARRLTKHRSASPGRFLAGCLAGALYDALPSRIRAARTAHPDLQIQMLEMEEGPMTDQVLSGALDMGFLYFPSADAELTCRVVSRKPQWVAISQDHPLANKSSLQVSDLAGWALILPDESAAPRLHRWYRAFLDTGGGKPFQYIGANQIHVALGLCAAGEGACVVAEHLKRVRDDDLRFVPLIDAPHTELSAIWRNDSPLRHVAAFVGSWHN